MSYLQVNAQFAFILLAVTEVVLGPDGEKLDIEYDFAIDRRDNFLAFAFRHYRPMLWGSRKHDDEIRFCLKRFYTEHQHQPGSLVEAVA